MRGEAERERERDRCRIIFVERLDAIGHVVPDNITRKVRPCLLHAAEVHECSDDLRLTGVSRRQCRC